MEKNMVEKIKGDLKLKIDHYNKLVKDGEPWADIAQLNIIRGTLDGLQLVELIVAKRLDFDGDYITCVEIEEPSGLKHQLIFNIGGNNE